MAARRNYKIYADIGPGATTLTRKLAVPNAGAGPHLLWKAELAVEDTQWTIMKALPDIRDANLNPLGNSGAISMMAQLRSYVLRTKLNVRERLGVPVALSCAYCDKYVEAIRPRMKDVELDNGVTVRIVLK